MIYLIHVPSLQLCKVGYAKNVAMRLRVGKAFIPGPHEVVAVRDGGRQLEKAIHRAAATHHLHGEWFRNPGAVSKIFDSTIFEEQASKFEVVVALERYLASEDISHAQFAVEVGGVSTSGVGKWVRGERIPRPNQVRRIISVTKGRVTANDFYPAILRGVA